MSRRAPFLLFFASLAFAGDPKWELLGEGYQLTADSAVAKDGSVYFTDARHDRIYKVDPSGRIALWKENSGGAHGIVSGPDGRLYAGQHGRKRIVRLDAEGNESIVAEDAQTHHLTVTKRGDIYFSDAPHHTIWLLDAARKKRAVSTAVDWPHVVRVSPDHSSLMVTDTHSRWVWTFRIEPDGSLADGRPFCRLETPKGSAETDAGGLDFGPDGFVYVATSLGVQVFDKAGALIKIIPSPGANWVSDVFFAGPKMKWLYVNDGDKLFRRPKQRGAP